MLLCEHPFTVTSDDGIRYQVGCGKCPTCLRARRWPWSQRLHAEFVHSVCTKFVTLTYDEPSFFGIETELNKGIELSSKIYIEDDDTFFPNVSKRDCQLWLKRLRKSFGKVLGKFKYFLVSEFGDKTFRPHYHVIMFFDKYIKNADLNLMILKTWRLGYILDVQDVRGSGAFSYLTNYLYKQVGSVLAQERLFDHYLNNRDYNYQSVLDEQEKIRNRPKTFMLVSRRPAIGLSYVTDKRIAYHNSDLSNVFACMPEYSTKIPLCSYLKKKIYSKDSLTLLNFQFIQKEIENKEKFIRDHNMTYEQYEDYLKEFRKRVNYNERIKQAQN